MAIAKAKPGVPGATDYIGNADGPAPGPRPGMDEWIRQAIKYANERVQFKRKISSFGAIQEKIADLTADIFASESLVYRLAGLLDDKLATIENGGDDYYVQYQKGIEEYAAECSITKVYGSEALDYCVDEYVQILGGYGFCAEYPAEQYYRDSRINRIWEGTNEINRMLVPGTMLKRAMQGRLDLLTPALAIGDELMSYSPLSVELPETPLAVQEHMVKMSKKVALMVAGLGAQKFQQNMAKEQEVMAKIADIIIEIFAMESGLLRTQKIIARDGEQKARYQIAAVKVYVDDMIPKIQNWANQILAYMEEGDMLRTQIAGARKFLRYTPVDSVTLRREVAERIIELESYPF